MTLRDMLDLTSCVETSWDSTRDPFIRSVPKRTFEVFRRWYLHPVCTTPTGGMETALFESGRSYLRCVDIYSVCNCKRSQVPNIRYPETVGLCPMRTQAQPTESIHTTWDDDDAYQRSRCITERPASEHTSQTAPPLRIVRGQDLILSIFPLLPKEAP